MAAQTSGILVFGGTGGTGLEIVKILSTRGGSVTVFVRETSDRSALEPLGVSFVVGDTLSAESVRAALTSGNFNTVISSLGSPRGGSSVDDVGTINIVDAAEAAGVERFLMVSSIGAGDSRDKLPFYVRWIFGAAHDRKTKAENHLKASSLQYTIIRFGPLADGPATGTGHLVENLEKFRLQSIPRAEVAQLLVRALDDPSAVGKVYHTVPNVD